MGLVINATPRSLCPQEETGYQLCRKLGGPQSWAVQTRKSLPPPGFDPRTVQLIASRYTDYSIPVHLIRCYAAPAVDLVRVVIAATSSEALLIHIVSTRTTIWLSRIGILFRLIPGLSPSPSGERSLSLHLSLSLSLSLSISIHVFYSFLITYKFDFHVISTYDQSFLRSNISPIFLLLSAL